MGRRTDSRWLRVPVAAGRLGPLRDPDAERDPPDAVPRDRRSEAAAERAGELHPRRQLHPRRSAGARRVFRLRRLQFRGHREQRWRGQARRRVDRQRRTAARPLGRRHPPIRAVSGQPPAPLRPHGRIARPALRDALAARGAGDGAAAAALAALRPPRREGRGVRQQDELGARELLSACGRRETSVHTRHAGMAAARRSTSSAPAARTSSSSIRRRSPSSSSRAATRWRCSNAHAQTRSTFPSGRWSTPRCSTLAAASKATSRSCALAPDEFFIITGSAQTTRDFAWIERAIRADEAAALVDVTSAYSVMSVMGPKAEALAHALRRGRSRQERHAVQHDTHDRRRPRARSRRADELRRRSRLRALRHDRPVRDALRRAVDVRRRVRTEGRRLLHDRCIAHRSRSARVGRRALARRNAVGSRARLRRENGQARSRSSAAKRCRRNWRVASPSVSCCSRSTIPPSFRGAASRS